MMSFRFLLIVGFLLIFAGAAQADPKWWDHDRYEDYRYEREYRGDGHRSKHQKKHYKDERKAAKKHYKQHLKEHQKLHRYYQSHHSGLPEWARRCGFPPGLAKRHKIPRGWEHRCRSGQMYYEHRREFRQDLYVEYPVIYDDQPSYQTVYEMDAADCKVHALHSAGDIAEGVALGAVFGGLIGAVIGSTRHDGGAGAGAVSGAAGGAVIGGILASGGYERDFRQCMKRRGHWRY